MQSFLRDLVAAVAGETDGARILGDASAFASTDRWNNFSGFRETTRNLAERYSRAGVESGLYEIPTGGPVGSGRWIIQQCADVERATLEMLSPERRTLADFAQCPWSVIQWTASTPPEGLVGRVLAVEGRGELERMRGRALGGAFALIRNFQWSLLPLLASRGALGVIVDSEVPNNPDARKWTKFGWGGIDLVHGTVRMPGMVVSAREGDRLRRILERGERVEVRMTVDARHYTGRHDMTWGRIEGAGDPQQEIWAISHSAEPGAIDNASGVAACLEAGRILAALIRSGTLERPKRSIRLLSGYECYSFFHYLEYEPRFQTPLAGVCVDSVGSKPEVCRGRLEWRRTVPMSAGFVNGLGKRVMRAAMQAFDRPYRVFDGGFVSTLDTLVGDPKYGFPCPWLTTHFQGPDRAFDAYHSSADTVELLSETGLAACATGLAAYLYFLADAGNAELLRMARSETDGALAELRSLRRAPEPRKGAPPPPPRAWRAATVREVHHTSLQRLRRWCWGGDSREIARRIGEMEAEVAGAAGGIRLPERWRRRRVPAGARAVPLRRVPVAPTAPGPENVPPWFAETLRKLRLKHWAHFWADGRRDLAAIAERLSSEYGRIVELPEVIEYFEAHQKLGYVAMARPDSFVSPRQLVRDLRRLGVKPGMNLMVHSSLSAIGHVEGGVEAVAGALVEAVGRTGTIMVPTFNHKGATVYNPATTPGISGAIGEALRQRPDAFRSDHTSHPVAAVGKRAEEFTRDHLKNGLWTPDSPLGRLMDAGGWVLCLGVDQVYSTHYHLAETAFGHCIDPKGSTGRVVLMDGRVNETATLAWRDGACPSDPAAIGTWLDRRGMRRKGRVGNADCTLTRARDIFDVRARMIRDHCPRCQVQPKTDPLHQV